MFGFSLPFLATVSMAYQSWYRNISRRKCVPLHVYPYPMFEAITSTKGTNFNVKNTQIKILTQYYISAGPSASGLTMASFLGS